MYQADVLYFPSFIFILRKTRVQHSGSNADAVTLALPWVFFGGYAERNSPNFPALLAGVLRWGLRWQLRWTLAVTLASYAGELRENWPNSARILAKNTLKTRLKHIL